jgi:putative addiction module component (TIGR02574 family)
MSPSTRELLNAVLKIPPAERAALAAQVIDSLDERSDADADEAWSEEVLRRCQELDSGAVRSIPWRTARRMILGQADELTDA